MYAGFWRRVGAYIVDYIVLAIVFGVLSLIFGVVGTASKMSAATATIPSINPLVSLISLIIGWLYFAIMESSSLQGTIGKLVFGIIVTDTNLMRIGFGRALGRYICKFISGIILLIGFLMAAFTAKKQALHDMIVGTLVVKKNAVRNAF